MMYASQIVVGVIVVVFILVVWRELRRLRKRGPPR